jgi:hypothetical protein
MGQGQEPGAELDAAFKMALTGWFRNPEKIDDNTGKALRFMWDAGRLYDEAQRDTLLEALKRVTVDYPPSDEDWKAAQEAIDAAS